MKRMGLLSIAFAATIALACGGNNDRSDIGANNTAGNNDAVGTAGDNQLSGGDRDFIEDLSAAGMAEVELGRLATERGQSAEVKRFAQMMIDEHTTAGDELKQVAGRYSFTPPAALEEKHRDLRDRLSGLQGAEFDREYMQAMVESHQDVIDQLESRTNRSGAANNYSADPVSPERSDNTATSAVNQWAAKTLPAAQKHLQEARTISERLEQGVRTRTN